MVGLCIVVGEYVDNQSITSGGGRNFWWIGNSFGHMSQHLCHPMDLRMLDGSDKRRDWWILLP